jgi:hypothetical protein
VSVSLCECSVLEVLKESRCKKCGKKKTRKDIGIAIIICYVDNKKKWEKQSCKGGDPIIVKARRDYVSLWDGSRFQIDWGNCSTDTAVTGTVRNSILNESHRHRHNIIVN